MASEEATKHWDVTNDLSPSGNRYKRLNGTETTICVSYSTFGMGLQEQKLLNEKRTWGAEGRNWYSLNSTCFVWD